MTFSAGGAIEFGQRMLQVASQGIYNRRRSAKVGEKMWVCLDEELKMCFRLGYMPGLFKIVEGIKIKLIAK